MSTDFMDLDRTMSFSKASRSVRFEQHPTLPKYSASVGGSDRGEVSPTPTFVVGHVPAQRITRAKSSPHMAHTVSQTPPILSPIQTTAPTFARYRPRSRTSQTPNPSKSEKKVKRTTLKSKFNRLLRPRVTNSAKQRRKNISRTQSFIRENLPLIHKGLANPVFICYYFFKNNILDMDRKEKTCVSLTLAAKLFLAFPNAKMSMAKLSLDNCGNRILSTVEWLIRILTNGDVVKFTSILEKLMCSLHDMVETIDIHAIELTMDLFDETMIEYFGENYPKHEFHGIKNFALEICAQQRFITISPRHSKVNTPACQTLLLQSHRSSTLDTGTYTTTSSTLQRTVTGRLSGLSGMSQFSGMASPALPPPTIIITRPTEENINVDDLKEAINVKVSQRRVELLFTGNDSDDDGQFSPTASRGDSKRISFSLPSLNMKSKSQSDALWPESSGGGRRGRRDSTSVDDNRDTSLSASPLRALGVASRGSNPTRQLSADDAADTADSTQNDSSAAKSDDKSRVGSQIDEIWVGSYLENSYFSREDSHDYSAFTDSDVPPPAPNILSEQAWD